MYHVAYIIIIIIIIINSPARMRLTVGHKIYHVAYIIIISSVA